MADKPWSGKVLNRGQVVQRLESLHCKKVNELTPVSEMWRAPTGQHFSISYDDIDAEVLAEIVAKIEKWVHEAPDRRD